MIDILRGRIAVYLSQHKVCIISTNGCGGVSSVRATYTSHGVELDCLVPRWSDALYHMEQDPHTLATILDTASNSMRWMQYRGIAQIAAYAAADRYVRVHISPLRVDLVDESHAWGARETLHL